MKNTHPTPTPLAISPLVEPIALRINDAVVMSGLSRSKLYAEMKAKRLKAVRVGGRRLILRQELQRYFAELSAEAA